MKENVSYNGETLLNMVEELIDRLVEATGLCFEITDQKTVTDGALDFFVQTVLVDGRCLLQLQAGNNLVDLVCYSPIQGKEKGFNSLTVRLLQGLAQAIWTDLMVRREALSAQVTWTWERLLKLALVEQWDSDRFTARAESLGLKTLPSGFPLLIHCSSWVPEVKEIIQGLLSNVSVQLINEPEIFLYVPLEVEESGPKQMHVKGRALINQIYSLFADDLGVKATVFVGNVMDQNLLVSLRAVRKLADIQRRFFPGRQGLTVWDCGLTELLSEIPQKKGWEFAEQLLGRLNKELLETLTVFLAKDLNLADASRTLFIHRNTLNYRLDRIEELTGSNPRSVEGAISLYLAQLLKQH